MWKFREICLLGMVSGALAAHPQTPAVDSMDSLLDMSIEQLMEMEVDTVVAASRYKQSVAEAPAAVTTITAEEIRLYGYRTLLDVLKSVPGFYATYDRNYAYLGLRGFGRPGDYNSRFLLLIDGHRINENIGDSLLLVEDFLLDVDLIEKVEIVRGPGSVLYGSNALFGVIHIITKKGGDYEGFEAASLVTSEEAYKNRLTYGRKFDSGGDLLVSGTLWEADGQSLYYPEYDDPSTNFGRVDNDDEQAKNVFLRTSWSDFTLVAAHNEREKGIPTGSFETLFDRRGNRTWDTMSLIGLTWEKPLDETLSVLGRVSYHHYNYDGRYLYDDGGVYVNKDYWKGRWWQGELQFTKTFSDRHRMIFGAEAQYNVRQDQKNWDFDVYLDSRQHSKSWGIYLQDEYRVFDNLDLFAGIRQDYYESSGHQVNPRLGLVYRHTEDTWIKLLYGQAFRVPSVYERYYEDSLTQQANPDLEPETIETWELVLEKYLDSVWRASASFYYYRIDDLIDQSVDGDGWIVFENVNQARARGAEATLEGKWKDGSRLRLSYAYVDTLDKSTRSGLANSPDHIAKGSWIVPLIPERVFAGIETQYQSKRRTLAGEHTDDAWLLDLTLTCENALNNLDLQVGIFNVFDTQYAHPASGEHLQDTLEQDGRTVGFKLNYRF